MSSQVISSFLLWLPLAGQPQKTPSRVFDRLRSHYREPVSTIHVAGKLVSKPYVDVTIDVLNWAGVKVDVIESGSVYRIPGNQKFRPSTSVFAVNGDYSSAAFILVAASLIDSDVLVRGLKADKQGDRAIVRILKQMGANVDDSQSDGVRVRGATPLHGVELDCSDIPDLVPILCVLGLFAEGRTVLKNISHLRYKETDRLKGPTEELRLLGGTIEHTNDSITIYKSNLVPNRVSARGDHRLAMSLIIAGLAGAGAEVDGAPSIKKSYPWFIRHMRSLGAPILG
jgi:3-phosphoshikimate 1-carboxyvinyltransferase